MDFRLSRNSPKTLTKLGKIILLDPKIFYRKLDAILSKISHTETGRDNLSKIVNELVEIFGKDLRFGAPRIYQESEKEYILISSVDEELFAKQKLLKEDEAVKILIENKSYIYDNPKFTIEEEFLKTREYSIAAGITVRSPIQRYIIIFKLLSGWEREEILLCLNAFVSALNQKLFNETFKNEIEQSIHIQQSLLPHSTPKIDGFDIFGKSVAAELVGGDLYDYFQHSSESFGICIGDASGHGLPAALLVRDVVTGLRMGLESHTENIHTLKNLNRVIYRSVLSTRFISLFYADIDSSGNVFYINAGHPPPIIIREDKTEQLHSTGMIFGALPEIDLQKKYAYLEKNNIMILYTDGIFEASNYKDQYYGEDRMANIVINNYSKSASEICKAIFDDVCNFTNKKNFDDDATILIVKKL